MTPIRAPKASRVGGDRDRRLGGGLEQQIIDDGFVVKGDVGDLGRQGENDVMVGRGQQIGFAFGQPVPGGGALAFGAVAIAAAVVGDARMCAVLAALDMAAEGRCAATLDRRHDLQLAKAHMAGVGFAPRRSMLAEDVRDLQRWPQHGRRALSRRGAGSCVLDETLQRADDVADGLGGDAGVKRRAVELGVAHQNLDHANIDAAFQQMGGEAVPQRMRRNALVDAGGVGGGVAGAIELARCQRTDAVLPGKQPALRPAALHQARNRSSSCGESMT